MNVKPGDIAIVCPPAIPENVGAIVHVLRAPTPAEEAEYDLDDRKGWIVESAGRPLALIDALGRVRHVKVRIYADDCLRPISDLPIEECDRLTEKEPA